MTHRPLISIITPAYRCRHTLPQALSSVQAQTFSDWEMLIVDDACPEQSWQSIAAAAQHDPRIRILHQTHNSGAAQSRNLALQHARGRYIAFLDADDYWLPEKLSRQLPLLAHSPIVFCEYWREHQGTRKRVTCPPRVSYRELLKSNVIGNLTAIYDADTLGKAYQQTRGHEDYIMWLELLQHTEAALAVNEALAVYRVSPESLSGSKLRAARWQWQIYRRTLGFSLPKAAYYFCHYAVRAVLKRY